MCGSRVVRTVYRVRANINRACILNTTIHIYKYDYTCILSITIRLYIYTSSCLMMFARAGNRMNIRDTAQDLYKYMVSQ